MSAPDNIPADVREAIAQAIFRYDVVNEQHIKSPEVLDVCTVLAPFFAAKDAEIARLKAVHHDVVEKIYGGFFGEMPKLRLEHSRLRAEVKAYSDAFDAQPWATDEPASVLLARITAEITDLKRAMSVINKWGADFIEEHVDEEDPNDPTKNCVAQWCIGGDFFPAATHDVMQAALAFADKYPEDAAIQQEDK